MNPDWESLRDFAALHAVGALDGEERTRLLETLPALSDAERREYNEFVRTAQLLGLAAPQVLPPPDLKRRIFARIGATPVPGMGFQILRGSNPWLLRLAARFGLSSLGLLRWALAGWLVTVAALAIGILFLRGGDSAKGGAGTVQTLQRERDTVAGLRRNLALLAAPQAQWISLHAADSGSASGSVLWDPPSGEALLQERGLPIQREFVLWAAVDGQATRVYRFRPQQQDGSWRIAMPRTSNQRISEFWISAQPDSDSVFPGGARWLQGAPP